MSTKQSVLSVLLLAAFLALSSHVSAHEHEASALGEPGDPKKVDRTVHIAMSDTMRYDPSSVTVKQGQTIRFILKNTGKGKHEMVLGTVDELKEHAALMLKFPEMEHADPNEASVEPGKTGRLVWKFTKAGTFDFACLQPGHYEGGMTGKVIVLAAADGTADGATTATDAGKSDVSATGTDASVMTAGEIKKIDKDAGKITIKHGPITNLGMPGMTMIFHVKDAAMLDQVKQGDKIKFTAERSNGALAVTKIQTAP